MKVNVSRLIGIIIGMVLSIIALFIVLVGISVTGGGEGNTNQSGSLGYWVYVIALLPYLFTCWLTYRFACTDDIESVEVFWLFDFYPRAFYRTVIAQICVWMLLASWILLMMWGGARQSHEPPHPRATPQPIIRN
jgi:hypothetical protein